MPYGITDCKWDIMPDLKEYWELRLNKIKDNGCFVLFGSQPFTTDLINSNRLLFKYEIIWRKNTSAGFIHAKNKPLKKHENILIFSKGNTIHASLSKNRMVYNPQGLIREDIIYKRNKINCVNIISKSPSHKTFFLSKYKNYPTSIFESFGGSNNKFIHPTQKPVALFEYLIKTYSNEGDLIFDGFSGSGTTAIASVNTKRNFICCENNKTYYNKSIERLKSIKSIKINEEFF
jgi:site-specific DNA-methyltransferase (adenine-specific)